MPLTWYRKLRVARRVSRSKTIDLDAEPFCPHGLAVLDHRGGGEWEWAASKVGLYVDPEQTGKGVPGYILRERLVGRAPCNANVLDYLLTNPSRIPKKWVGKRVYFWGTVYCDPDGSIYVRYLYLGVNASSGHEWVGSTWDDDRSCAAILAT